MTDKKFGAPVGCSGLYILDTAAWRVLKPVMDKSKCVNCGICMTFCPVFSILRDESKQYYIDYTYCKGCGICAAECPKKAISMVPEGGKN